MSLRNWLSITAIGGLIALLLGVEAFGVAPRSPIQSAQAQQTADQQPNAAPTPPAAATKDQKPSPAVQQDACDEPANAESDHCIQLRMAIAAEEQTKLSARQIIWTAIESFLLFATVVFTAVAAYAAVVAAKAAQGSVKVTEDTAQRQLRAYVCVTGAILKPMEDSDGFAVIVTIQNSGATPAYDLEQWSMVAVREFPLKKPLEGHTPRIRCSAILAPGAQTMPIPTFKRPLSDKDITAIETEMFAIYVYGEITYRDAFGKDRFTKFNLWCSGQGAKIGFFKAYKEGNSAN